MAMTCRTLPIFALAALLAPAVVAGAWAQSPKFEPGARSGPFVATDRSLTTLAGDGYEIRGNLGTALILQKGPSIYSCQIPPDPEALGYKPYFVCAELKEEAREAVPAVSLPGRDAPMPRTGN